MKRGSVGLKPATWIAGFLNFGAQRGHSVAVTGARRWQVAIVVLAGKRDSAGTWAAWRGESGAVRLTDRLVRPALPDMRRGSGARALSSARCSRDLSATCHGTVTAWDMIMLGAPCGGHRPCVTSSMPERCRARAEPDG